MSAFSMALLARICEPQSHNVATKGGAGTEDVIHQQYVFRFRVLGLLQRWLVQRPCSNFPSLVNMIGFLGKVGTLKSNTTATCD